MRQVLERRVERDISMYKTPSGRSTRKLHLWKKQETVGSHKREVSIGNSQIKALKMLRTTTLYAQNLPKVDDSVQNVTCRSGLLVVHKEGARDSRSSFFCGGGEWHCVNCFSPLSRDIRSEWVAVIAGGGQRRSLTWDEANCSAFPKIKVDLCEERNNVTLLCNLGSRCLCS